MDNRRREALSGKLRTLSSTTPQVLSTGDGDSGPPDASSRHAHGRRYEIYSLFCDALMRKQAYLVLISCVLIAGTLCHSQSAPSIEPRVIELTAGRDSRYRLGRKVAPTIEVRSREPLILRITAVRAETMARDGSVHGLALLDKKSEAVPGWTFSLHPGVQDLVVSAPARAGSYTAVCTVICSDGHDGMGFTLLVTDSLSDKRE